MAGDQVHHRPRAHEGFGDPDTHLSRLETSVIFAFFGYNESFDEDPDGFAEHLSEWIDHTLSQQYDGVNPPRIVLVSPIAHENLGDPNLPDGSENNGRLEIYARKMAEVAEQKEVTFVNLFDASRDLYESTDEPLTVNGVHVNTEGNRRIAQFIAEDLLGRQARVSASSREKSGF